MSISPSLPRIQRETSGESGNIIRKMVAKTGSSKLVGSIVSDYPDSEYIKANTP